MRGSVCSRGSIRRRFQALGSRLGILVAYRSLCQKGLGLGIFRRSDLPCEVGVRVRLKTWKQEEPAEDEESPAPGLRKDYLWPNKGKWALHAQPRAQQQSKTTNKKRKAREARNPATNETVSLKERFVPTFKVSKILKKAVNQSLLRGF